MKIYVEFFRFKKHDLQEKGSYNILQKNLAYFSIIFLTLLFILSNIQSKNEVSAATENQISKTVMASLVQNKFSSISSEEEELIVDSYVPSADFVAEQKKAYLEATMENRTGLVNEVTPDTSTSDAILINDDAVAVKPKGLANLASSDNEVSSNSQVATERNEIINYTVQKGDTISTIASRFDVTINTILWANDLASYSVIRPGDILSILPSSGVLHTVKSGDTISRIASIYNIDENEIISENNLGAVLKIGEKIMVPGGVKPKPVVAVQPKPAPSTGVSIIRDLVKTPEVPVVNDTPAPATSDKMAWPTEGRRITQYYSWRHTGLDIANKTGTPLYAAEAGTIEYSGWSNGYGYNVLINHGGGKKTRYAHASELFVKAGDSVSRGQTVAAMGSTGWSTGPHIHFEVIINGTKYNPLNYIK